MPGCRDVVVGALDRLYGDVGDLGNIHPFAVDHEPIPRNVPLFEDAFDRGQVEFRRHVHHGKILVVEPIVPVVLLRFALGHAHDLIEEGGGVGICIHRDEARKLLQARIHHAARTGILEADPLQNVLLQLPHGHPPAEVGDLRRSRIRVDRPADQHQRVGLCIRLFAGQIGCRREGQWRRLTDRNDMGIGAQMADEVHEVQRVILDVELAFRHRDVARIVPVSDIDLTIGQERHDGGAQERRVVPRHRCYEQNLTRQFPPTLDVKMDQTAERAFDQRFDVNEVIPAVLAHDGRDIPVGLGHHAREAPLGHFAPGGGQLHHGIRGETENGVGKGSFGSRTHPLVRDPQRLHEVVGHHVFHSCPFPGRLTVDRNNSSLCSSPGAAVRVAQVTGRRGA